MRVILCAVVAMGLVAGCERQKDRVSFNDQYYRAKLSKVDGNRMNFVITVRPVSADLDGAREAGRYEATKHCIENNGSSNVAWGVGPETDPETLVIANDTLTFDGTCIE